MRIQEFPEPNVQELKILMSKAGMRTYHELFNNALTLTKWAIQEAEQGRLITSLDERTGKVKELAMPFLQAAAEKVGAQTAQTESASAALRR